MIALIVIAAAVLLIMLLGYRIDRRKRESGKSDRTGMPWNWEDWQ